MRKTLTLFAFACIALQAKKPSKGPDPTLTVTSCIASGSDCQADRLFTLSGDNYDDTNLYTIEASLNGSVEGLAIHLESTNGFLTYTNSGVAPGTWTFTTYVENKNGGPKKEQASTTQTFE